MGDNELWQAFLFEVNEQLEQLEQTLMAIQQGAAHDRETINQVFRYFHSIKSSCAMFEFAGMEAIAHAAESVLDEIRKGITALTAAHLQLLLKTVDCLKEQLAEAEATDQAPAVQSELLQQLLDCVAGEKSQLQQEDSEVNALGIDPVAMEEFAALSAASLQRFAMALKTFSMGLENASLDDALLPLKRWSRACQALGFTQLANDLSQLLQLAESRSAGDTGAALSVLAQIIDQIKALEEISGQAFALDEVFPWLENLYIDYYAAALNGLQQQLQACLPATAQGSGVDVRQLDRLCESLDELLKLFRVFGFAASRDLLRYFNQLCRKAILGQLLLDSGMFALLDELIQAHRQALGDYARQREVDARCADAVTALRLQVNRETDDAFGRSERLAALTACLDIPDDYLDYVENTDIEALEYALQVGKTIALVLVDLEANRDWANAFVHWLNPVEIITSRTVFCQKEVDGRSVEYTKTSFLLVFDADADTVRQSLAALPDSERYIESLVFSTPALLSDEKPVVQQNLPGRQREEISAADSSKSGAGKPEAVKAENNKSIRIGSEVVDRFVVQVGEMVLRRNMLSHAIHNRDIDQLLKKCKAILDNAGSDEALRGEALAELKASLGDIAGSFDELLAANEKLDQSVSFVQEEVMSLRVVPIGIVFNRLPRIVRHINSEYGKDIRLEISGEEVRVDKSMVDILMEPLVHLVRNCADHGIETAAERQRLGKTAPAEIKVAAEQSGNTLLIRVADNGAGLNYPRIRDKAIRAGLIAPAAEVTEEQLKQLIFAPGFSTSEVLTETSGRGVGMDAVKTSLLAIGGSIDVQSHANAGTVFTLKVPVSAAIQGVIVFRHQHETLTIPERNVVCGLTIDTAAIQSVQGQAAFLYQGDIIPVYGLSQLLNWADRRQARRKAGHSQEVLIITDDSHRMALAVDKVIGRQEIFVRNLHSDLMALPGVGGASILGNGQVALILNAEELMQIASRNSQGIESLLKVS